MAERVISAYDRHAAQLDMHDVVERDKLCPLEHTPLIYRGDAGDHECTSCGCRYTDAEVADLGKLQLAAADFALSIKEKLESEEIMHGDDMDHLGWIVNKALETKLIRK